MSRETRKEEHVQLALQSQKKERTSDFDQIRLVHRSFPETRVQDVRLDTRLGGLRLDSPLLINAMTGGASAVAAINAQLASVAADTGIALAVGSQHAALRDGALSETYKIVRRVNPRGVIFANIGATAPADYAQRAVDMVEANALQLHINVPQELVMPEGDRDFRGVLANIAEVVRRVDVPVIVKEVGFGMAMETVRALTEVGVRIVDVGGRGGTDFIWIENERREKREWGFLQGFGQSTVVSLLEVQTFQAEAARDGAPSRGVEMVASGGIRHALDMAKCFALGARMVGIAGPALRILQEMGVAGLRQQIEDWHHQLRSLCTLLGAETPEQLTRTPFVCTGDVLAWAQCRGMDLTVYGRRETVG